MCIIRDLMSSGDGPVNVLEFAALARARMSRARTTTSRARPATSARCSKTASATTGPLWFQLYVYKDREMTRDLAGTPNVSAISRSLVSVRGR